jgi:hypothetical protein
MQGQKVNRSVLYRESEEKKEERGAIGKGTGRRLTLQQVEALLIVVEADIRPVDLLLEVFSLLLLWNR